MKSTRSIVSFLLEKRTITSLRYKDTDGSENESTKVTWYSDGTKSVEPSDKSKPIHVVNENQGIDVKFFAMSGDQIGICDNNDESKLTIASLKLKANI